MEAKWEDLDADCLANVFGRMETYLLLVYVSLVCKSWYKVTLNPHCWESLRFPKLEIESSPPSGHDPTGSHELCIDSLWFYPLPTRYTYELLVNMFPTSFITNAVNRSRGCAKLIELPIGITPYEMQIVADKCPELKVLLLPFYDFQFDIVPYISYWNKLEFLRLGNKCKIQEILAAIGSHCKNFIGLCVTEAYIFKEEASSIVTFVPNIKYLILRYASIDRNDLVTILNGCRQLELLDVRDCKGFDGHDDLILKLGSHIRKFMCEGSTRDRMFEMFHNIFLAYR